jgi:hypothetical protein
MTDRPARSRSGIVPVALAALAAFLVVLLLLTVQMRLGADPALKARPVAAAPPKRILVRRIERRTILVRVVPAETDDHPSVAITARSAPAAPSPAPVAAPAPAPAPIVTRSS